MGQHPDTWTAEGVKGGLLLPRDRGLELAVYRGRVGKDGVRGGTLDAVWCTPVFDPPAPPEEAVTALGYSGELAHHLFRECWLVGTGSKVDLCRVFGWVVVHYYQSTETMKEKTRIKPAR